MTDIASARDRLAAERARLARVREAQRPPIGTLWRPTPTRFENNTTAASPSNIVMRKVWDTSPIDSFSFDGSTPPQPGPPPVCTIAPSIIPLTGLAVGDQLAGGTGTWTGVSTYARQWF
jgi:hypothetical protein